jgi:hypothetical protein
MPDNIVRLDDFEHKAVMSPLGGLALGMVEFMGKAGLTTAPKDPTDEMVAAYDASDLGVSDSAG